MAEINKTDIQFKSSQRLDDTEVGGGQMISTVIQSGAVNALFPDISRLDRVYGRVSLRKGYVAVNTDSRVTYYGSHAVLTQQTADPNVSVCFFSSKNWFDTRSDARDRIESYLVKGPQYMAALWGNHYTGTKNIALFSHIDATPPVMGDVIVLIYREGFSDERKQYLRITDISTEVRDFTHVSNGTVYKKLILFITTSDLIQFDFPGNEVDWAFQFTTANTKIYTTVAADASRYYGISPLADDAFEDELAVRVESIFTHLVPSAQSETAITDSGVGTSVAPIVQLNSGITSVSRSLSYSITASSKLYLGEAILPGSFSWTGGIPLTDDGAGNIYSSSSIVGSIEYANGTIIFINPGGTYSGTGTATYIPACAPTEVSETGAIFIKTSNRGFTYVYNCDPLPKKGTLRVDYLSAGKWYTLRDVGNGQLKGYDASLGSGVVNFISGSVSLTLGGLPDVDSYILLFWAKDAAYYDLSGETLVSSYSFKLNHEGITKDTVKITWGSPTQYVLDDGNGLLVRGTSDTVKTAEALGTIKYATGECEFFVSPNHTVIPTASTSFRIRYSYGVKHSETFNPIRNGNGTVTFFLTNTPIKPGTFEILWHTDQIEYYSATNITMIAPTRTDPTHQFQDNGSGGFRNENPAEFSTYIASTINYTTGEVMLMPDRKGTFPIPIYRWSSLRITDLTSTDAAGNPTVTSQRMFEFDRLQYLPAASIWPTDGIFECKYTTTDGANLQDYNTTLKRYFYIKSDSKLELIPASVSFFNSTVYIIDAGNGKLYKNIVGTTGVGTEVGNINYGLRRIELTDGTLTSRTITIKQATGTIAIDPVQLVVFRCPASPIRNSSFGIRATMNDGTIISATSDFDGKVIGTYILGTIDYNNGIGRISFGEWVPDNASAQAQPWYTGAPDDGAGNVWKPVSVRASTVLINCVVTSYIPLDSSLLGLDPVRLPMDGKVPIFRDGYIVLVHNTQNETVTISGAGALPAISRHPVNLLEIYDANGKYWPDAGNYTVDLDTGVITILPTYSLPPYDPGTGDGYQTPMKALHRIEDLALASDVQITGHIALTSRLTHDYPKNTSFVSSVLPIGDLQSRAYNEFEQSTWTGVWSDDLIGTQPLSSYNFVDFPISVINKTCTKERWLILFQSGNTIRIVGENAGVLADAVSILTGNYNITNGSWLGDAGFNQAGSEYAVAVRNRNFGALPYWYMRIAGFGAGWAANNCIRFNTDAANYPLWIVRTTLQAPPTVNTDSYIMQIRGDSA